SPDTRGRSRLQQRSVGMENGAERSPLLLVESRVSWGLFEPSNVTCAMSSPVAYTSADRRALWGTARSAGPWALHPLKPLLPQDVRGDHRGGDIFVPQERLDRAHVLPCHQSMRGETVAERVRRRALHHPGVPDGQVDGPLDRLLVDVMALESAGARVGREPVGRKHILPTPFPIGMGVFAC